MANDDEQDTTLIGDGYQSDDLNLEDDELDLSFLDDKSQDEDE